MGNEVWLHAIEAHIVKGRILLKELEVHFQGRRDESDKNIEFSTRGAIFVGQRHKPWTLWRIWSTDIKQDSWNAAQTMANILAHFILTGLK